MTSYREIVYLVLDEIKALGGDSTITEEHVIFLANHYRLFLLDQKIQKQGVSSLSSSNEQTICIDLEKSNAIPGLKYCNGEYLKSIQEIPSTVNNTLNVYPLDYFNINIAYVTKDRFKFVGYNKYMQNIIYCTLGADNHLYFKSNNPQYLYMEKAKATGIFEDSEAASELACNSSGTVCDILDQEFPLESTLIPQLIELTVKELASAAWRQADYINNSKDDLSNLISYMANNTKSDLAKKISE